MKLLTTIFVLISVNASFINAQIIEDAGRITYTIYSEGDVKNSSELENRSFTFSTLDAWTPLPQLKLGKAQVFTNLSYRYLSVDYDNEEAVFYNRPTNLQEVKSTIFVQYPINESWSVLGMAIPSFASDFKDNISKDDFLIQGGIAMVKKLKIKSKLEIGVGVFASYVFGELTYLPAVVVDYKSANEKWVAQAYWPKLTVLRNIKNDWQFGISASIEGTQYNIQNFVTLDNSVADYAEYSIIQTGVQINKKLYKSIWLQFQSGYAFNNNYILYDRNNNKIENGDYSLDDLMYGKILLTYRM